MPAHFLFILFFFSLNNLGHQTGKSENFSFFLSLDIVNYCLPCFIFSVLRYIPNRNFLFTKFKLNLPEFKHCVVICENYRTASTENTADETKLLENVRDKAKLLSQYSLKAKTSEKIRGPP